MCERLDRLPLALELGRCQGERPPDRNDPQEARRPAGDADPRPARPAERQQTLRETISLGFQLLDSREQQAFARLGVFAGGWTLEAADAICEVDVDDLASLIDKSLVVGDEHGRYGMLKTIREYASERMTEAESDPATFKRRAESFIDFAEGAYPNLRGSESSAWLEHMDSKHEKLRATLSFLLQDEDLERAVQLAGALSRFWMTRGHCRARGSAGSKGFFRRGGKQKRRVRALPH